GREPVRGAEDEEREEARPPEVDARVAAVARPERKRRPLPALERDRGQREAERGARGRKPPGGRATRRLDRRDGGEHAQEDRDPEAERRIERVVRLRGPPLAVRGQCAQVEEREEERDEEERGAGRE